MENAAPARPNFLHRTAGECGRCIRDPLRPFLLFVFWRIQNLDDARAIRFVGRLRQFLRWPSRRTRRRHLEMTGVAAHWTSAQKQDFEERHRQYLARMNVQLVRLWTQTRLGLIESVRVSGLEHVTDAMSGGQGALVLAAHAGTWIQVPLYLGALGCPVNSFLNPSLPPTVKDYLKTMMARYGALMSFVGQSGYDAARAAFGRGEVIATAVDLSMRSKRSAWLPFGDAELQMDSGTAILAIRRRVPVVWANCFHDEQGRPCIKFLAPETYGPGRERSTPEAVLARWAELIHENFRRRPEQWWALNFCSLRPAQKLESAPDTICA